MTQHVQTLYAHRFQGIEEERDRIWKVLVRYFQQWIRPTDTVLDLGAGYCEFINNIEAKEKLALDLNPVTPSKAASGVKVISQDISKSWAVDSDSIDFVFTSNFFEHLSSKEDLKCCLNEINRVLRPGGILLAMGPNIRFCFNVYWDFFDHHLPLSDRSLTEVLELIGLKIERAIPRFLPYTMAHRRPFTTAFVRLYLRMPIFWPLFGKQFLVVARKPNVPLS